MIRQRTPGELGVGAGTGALARTGHWEAAAETRELCRMSIRLFCILLAAVSGAQGWGYCECGVRRPAGLGPGVQSLQGGSRTALRLGGRRSVPGQRALAGSLSSFPASPPRSAMQLGGWRARPVLGLGLEPRIESALAGIWLYYPSQSWCLGLRVGDKSVTGDLG